jgi:hypothetical protein
MRNQPKPLDHDDAIMQAINQRRLMNAKGTVSVSYVKRNGQKSSSTGKVGFFNGRVGFDTGSVTIETEDKGPRTINLHSIVAIKDVP